MVNERVVIENEILLLMCMTMEVDRMLRKMFFVIIRNKSWVVRKVALHIIHLHYGRIGRV